MKKKLALLCSGWAYNFVQEFINGMKAVLEPNSTDIYVFSCYSYSEHSGYLNYTGFSIYKLINYEDYDGIIILSDLINNARVLEKERLRILESKKPAVSINLPLKGISCIRLDNYNGAYDVIEHLFKHHHLKNIAHVAGKESAVDFAERYKAYRFAHSDHNVKLNMDYVFTIDKSSYNDAYEFGMNFFKSEKPLPEAFVCANDLIALGLINAAHECGINVPDQLKVVGYDNIPVGKSSVPALTTVKSNTEILGSEAVKYIFSNNGETENINIKSTAVFRNTCGCEYKIDPYEQAKLSTNLISDTKTKDEFLNHLQIMDDVFTEATDVFTLLTNLELYFSKSHLFEGTDFCIFMKTDWSSILINSEETLPLNLSYGTSVQSIVSIQGGVKYPREIIAIRDLVPAKMHTPENNIFLFFPIYNHSYVHGYYVTKNNFELVNNHFGYNWTRNFGNSIERFRKRNMYKQQSQQLLRLSTRDALSGMLNRIGLEKLAKPFYAQNKKMGLTTVLFFVDINKMKLINDNFGHLHGDLAVKTIAAAIMEVIPKTWLPIRYGGDEFLIVGNSKNYKGEDYCAIITNRIAQKTAIMQLPYNLSASVGTYSVPANSPLTLEEAVEKVDDIMYQVKQEYHKMN